MLEDRRLLAGGPILIENFSDDADPTMPGLDSSGNFHHAFSGPFDLRTFSGIPISPDANPSLPFALLLAGTQEIITFPSVTADESVILARVNFVPLDSDAVITFIGAGSALSFTFPQHFEWEAVSVTSNTLGSNGAALGPIQEILVSSQAALFDNVAILIQQNPVNAPPLARDDFAMALPGVSTFIDVLGNDSDLNADILSITSVTQPANGQVTFNPATGVVYTPNPGFHGLDTFLYSISDGHGGTASASVAVRVNTPPLAFNQVIQRPHGGTGLFTVDAPGVLDRSVDADGDPVTARLDQDATHGHVDLQPDGSFTYTPAAPDGRVVDDFFTYRLNDGFADSDPAVVDIRVDNHVPVARDLSLELAHDQIGQPYNGNLRDLVTDGDVADVLSVASFTTPDHGSLIVQADGHFSYTLPPAGFLDADFDFTMTDGYAISNRGSVHLHWINSPPLETRTSFVVPSDFDETVLGLPLRFDLVNGGHSIQFHGMLDGAIDADIPRDQISLVSVTAAIGSVSSVQPDGSFIYSPGLGCLTELGAFLYDTLTFHLGDSFETSQAQVQLGFDELAADRSQSFFDFLTGFCNVDDDHDGVNNMVEQLGPNHGDGNFDGIPDAVQNNVASLPGAGGFLTLASDSAPLADVSRRSSSNPPGPNPPSVLFPFGFLSFDLTDVMPATGYTVTLFLPETVRSPGAHYFKFGPTPDNTAPHWYDFHFDGTTGAELLPDRIILHFVDGARGDGDLAVNGVIADPGGPAVDHSPVSPTASFVTGLYHDVVNRAPAAAEVAAWVALLQAGATRFQVSAGFWTSPEHRGIQVDQFYAQLLHRPADGTGRALWMNALLAGVSEVEVARAFVLSPEYTAAHPDDASFVEGLYQDLLGRGSDLVGRAFWMDMLSLGVRFPGVNPLREAVAQAFVTSAEGYEGLLDRYYADFLHRPGDSPGRDAWLGILLQQPSAVALVGEAFLASDEYFAQVAR